MVERYTLSPWDFYWLSILTDLLLSFDFQLTLTLTHILGLL